MKYLQEERLFKNLDEIMNDINSIKSSISEDYLKDFDSFIEGTHVLPSNHQSQFIKPEEKDVEKPSIIKKVYKYIDEILSGKKIRGFT